MNLTDTFTPIGHVCTVNIGGDEVARRFVFDEDVRQLTLDVHRAYPQAYRTTAAMYAGMEGAARYVITLNGPENPGNVARVAHEMALPDVEA